MVRMQGRVGVLVLNEGQEELGVLMVPGQLRNRKLWNEKHCSKLTHMPAKLGSTGSVVSAAITIFRWTNGPSIILGYGLNIGGSARKSRN